MNAAVDAADIGSNLFPKRRLRRRDEGQQRPKQVAGGVVDRGAVRHSKTRAAGLRLPEAGRCRRSLP